MPNSNFSEESFFFLHIDSVCRTPAITCSPDLGVIEAARLMREQNTAGIVVVEDETPIGILSVHDLRDLIATAGEDFSRYKAGDIMQVGTIPVRNQAYVFEAIFKMAKNNTHDALYE